jgi:hypothetical protein
VVEIEKKEEQCQDNKITSRVIKKQFNELKDLKKINLMNSEMKCGGYWSLYLY